jgi:hypothetical protein
LEEGCVAAGLTWVLDNKQVSESRDLDLDLDLDMLVRKKKEQSGNGTRIEV